MASQTPVRLPLEKHRLGGYFAVIEDETALDDGAWLLAVRADVAEGALRRGFPSSTRIGPLRAISRLVNLPLPGVRIAPLAAAPPQLPFAAGTAYFELDCSGEYFRLLAAGGGMIIHASDDWPNLEIELWAVDRLSGS